MSGIINVGEQIKISNDSDVSNIYIYSELNVRVLDKSIR